MTQIPPRPPGEPSAEEGSLTLAEAAQILGLDTGTVREYVRRGELEGRLVNRRWRFRRGDVDAFWKPPSQWDCLER
jgi:excisionase family DNA binding protein